MQKRQSGLTLVEIMIVVALVGAMAAAVVFPLYGKYRSRVQETAAREDARVLNQAITHFRSSDGSLTGTDTGASVLLKLQTPLDDTSVKSTGAWNALIDLSSDLTAYNVADGKPRLVYDAVNMKFNVATSGDGYQMIRLARPKTISEIARTKSGLAFGTTSKWVWEYTDTAAPSGAPAVTIGIAGPSSITSPGDYSWTLTSNTSGPITLSLINGQRFSANGTTITQSLSFRSGDVFTFIAQGNYEPADPSLGKSTSLAVNVNIPAPDTTVVFSRETGGSSTAFSYAEVTSTSTVPSVRNGINLSVVGNPPGVVIYYSYDGSDPTLSSNLYSGAFHIPINSWSSSVPLKAIAYDPTAARFIGQIGVWNLTPAPVQLAPPNFTPGNGATLTEQATGTPVTVTPADPNTGSVRVSLNGAPSAVSSNATTIVIPKP